MPDNAPFHVSKLTHEFFENKIFTGEKMITQLPSCPDLNLIENLWSLVKIRFYKGGKQYSNKSDQWEAIKTIMLKIESAEVKKINKYNGQ